MRSERRSMPEQELSIKEREQELYDEPREPPPAKPPVKPFPIYLRETPAVPMSSGVKATLWVVGIVVVLLLIAALLRTQQSSRIRRGSAVPRASAMITPDHEVRESIPPVFKAVLEDRRDGPRWIEGAHPLAGHTPWRDQHFKPGRPTVSFQVPNSGRLDESWD